MLRTCMRIKQEVTYFFVPAILPKYRLKVFNSPHHGPKQRTIDQNYTCDYCQDYLDKLTQKLQFQSFK